MASIFLHLTGAEKTRI